MFVCLFVCLFVLLATFGHSSININLYIKNVLIL